MPTTQRPGAVRQPAKPKEPTAEEKALEQEQARLKGVKDAQNKVAFKVRPILRNGQIPDAERRDVDEYFTHYIDILISPAAAALAPETRQDIRRDVRILGNAPDKTGLDYVNTLLLNKFKQVIDDTKLRPVARYQCMLALGELNEVEPTTGGSGPFKPLPAALVILHKGATQADMPPAVKVAALVGILRHAQSGIADKALERQIVQDMAKLVQQTTYSSDNTADGHLWMRRRALDILEALKQPGPSNEVVNALVATINDKNNPVPVRLDALRVLGNFKVPPGVVKGPMAKELGQLTLDFIKNETNRRALRAGMSSIALGMRGADGQAGLVTGVSDPEDRKKTSELGTFVAKLSDYVGDPRVPPEAIVQEMPIYVAELENWLFGDEAAAGVVPTESP